MLSSIFEQFVEESPISVMARVLMERVFAPERMDSLFTQHASVQYQQDLLFSIRAFAAKPLPGKAIVVLDPKAKLVTDIFPCADGHAQERSLLDFVLNHVKPQELWDGDRNFCTAKFLFTIAGKKAFFVIRQHGAMG